MAVRQTRRSRPMRLYVDRPTGRLEITVLVGDVRQARDLAIAIYRAACHSRRAVGPLVVGARL